MKDVSLILYTVADMDKAKQFFRELNGVDPYVDQPYYVGFKCANIEIGLTPATPKSQAGGVAYWRVDDIAATIKGLVAAGGTVGQEPTDVGGGMQVASVKEPNGTVIGLRQFPKG